MPDRMVTIARFRDLPEALIQLSKLESAGIRAELRDDHTVRMAWTYSNAVGGIQLQVPEAEREEAEAILGAATEPTLEMPSPEGSELFSQPRCPRCASLEIELRPGNLAWSTVALFAGPLPIPLGRGEWHCSDCNARWEVVPEPGESGADDADPSPGALYAATTNKGKLQEYRDLAMDVDLSILPVADQEGIPEVEEDGDTFEANAAKKAAAYSCHVPGAIVFADDSGIEVTALNGAPGVLSARYAARSDTHKPTDSDNNYKLLRELESQQTSDRTARFVCVIAAARDGEVLGSFRGEAHGEILVAPLGKRGFGYDPLFYVPEANKTFGEMKASEKAKYSHRGAAFRKFLQWMDSNPKG